MHWSLRSLKRSGETRNIISIDWMYMSAYTKDPSAQWLSYCSESINTLSKEYVIVMELSGLSVLGHIESASGRKCSTSTVNTYGSLEIP